MTSLFQGAAALPRLCATRVDLRWLSHADAPALFAVFGDPEVVRFWSSPALPDLAGAEALVDEIHELFAARRLFQWGIALRESDEVVGTCTLFNVDGAHRRAEVGFALRRDLWGRGLVSEALGALFGFAFGTLGLHRIEADVDPANERSLRALERQGFRREGYLRERWHLGGATFDAVFLGLLARDWTFQPDAPSRRSRS